MDARDERRFDDELGAGGAADRPDFTRQQPEGHLRLLRFQDPHSGSLVYPRERGTSRRAGP